MLDLVLEESERIDSRFLEPACGNGNFLSEVLIRKLNIVKQWYSKNQVEYERYSIVAISSIYGIDILKDNVINCQERLYEIFRSQYVQIFNSTYKEDCLKSAKFVLSKNIIWGDALSFKNRNYSGKLKISSKYVLSR